MIDGRGKIVVNYIVVTVEEECLDRIWEENKLKITQT